jgi:signal transduction histidine kinase
MIDETVERKTLIGFIVAAALMMLVSAVAILSVRTYGHSAEWVAHTHEVIGELEALYGALSSAEAARRGYLASGDASYLDERAAALSKLESHLQNARLLTSDNQSQQARLLELDALLAKRASKADDMIIRAQIEGLESGQRGLNAQEVREATTLATAKIEEIEDKERGLLASRRGADTFSANVLIGAFAGLLLTGTAVLTWLCLRIRNEMSERARQSAALDRANQSLEAANRELEGFSYSVSHDLRAPLRAIDGYSKMLEENYGAQLDETGLRYIRTVRSGSQRMAALIDDLLAFARLSRQSLNLQTVDMTTLARRAAAEVLDAQPEPKPAVRIPELPPVRGDPALLRQVWTNLIGNAVKYSSKSPAPAIEVRAAAEGRLVRYEVRDNGVGFDMRYADKLFGVFQRLHSADEYPGTGVGLAIVQRIVNRHEGAVSAHGERGKGATFGFTLPAEV